MLYKQGEKNGKKWAGNFCQNQECKFVEWQRSGATKFVKQGNELKVHEEPDWQAIRIENDKLIKENMRLKSEGMAKGAAFNKSCDIAIALYQKGDIQVDIIIQKVEEIFNELRKINE